MSAFHDNALIGASGQQGYKISRSVRLRSSASAYLNWTPASAGNRKTWTMSMWLKRGALSTYQMPFSCFQSGGGALGWQLNTDNTFDFYQYNSAYQFRLVTTPVFRDPSAWYHFVFVVDTTQATASNRIKVYVNGTQITAFSTATYPTQNTDLIFNYAQNHNIGQYASNNTNYFDGYLTEINFIDGQALTPSSFGQTNSVTGVWQPIKYAGTYGTNGFYLNFSDNSAATAAAIGKDYSGNGNNWTPNNISVTAGVTYDSMLDVPTMWADGGNGRGNYCTLNPIGYITAAEAGTRATITNGNLSSAYTTGVTAASIATMSVNDTSSIGKWYWEATLVNAGCDYGIMNDNSQNTATRYSVSVNSTGGINVDASAVQSGLASFSVGDVIGVAVDTTAWTVQFYRNGSAYGSAATISATARTYQLYPFIACASSVNHHSAHFNFGQRPFSYTPPTGFKALNTQNLPDATIKAGNKYFDVVTRTGNGTSYTNSSLQFQPDLLWSKDRSVIRDHRLVDSVRGVTKEIYSDLTSAEATDAAGLTAFNANGYSIGSSAGYNQSGNSLVDWLWKKGATQGFDIQTFTAPASGNFTVNHSLGVVPAMIILKDRAAVVSWTVWHKALSNPAQSYLALSNTNAAGANTTVWGNTAPTSTQVTLGVGGAMNANDATVAYLFAEVAGFSKFGSYTGNGSADGAFVYTGFRPKFILVKRTDSAGNWYIYDTVRETYNALTQSIYPNLSNAEANDGATLDILSNGFKWRRAGVDQNASGGTYIFAAFAENPFKNSLAR